MIHIWLGNNDEFEFIIILVKFNHYGKQKFHLNIFLGGGLEKIRIFFSIKLLEVLILF